MSTAESNKQEPAKTSQAEEVAQKFVAAELELARKGLKKTQTVGVVLLLLVSGYVTFLTTALSPYLTASGAANTATDIIYAQTTERAPMIADQLRKQIPGMVAKMPDVVLEKLPEWRGQIEEKAQETMTEQLQNHSGEFGKHLDAFLDKHKQEIGELLKATNEKNNDKLKVMMTAIEMDILDFLKEKNDKEESIQEKLDGAMETLTKLEKQMDRLANGSDLTEQEAKARRAIAIITQKIDLKKDE